MPPRSRQLFTLAGVATLSYWQLFMGGVLHAEVRAREQCAGTWRRHVAKGTPTALVCFPVVSKRARSPRMMSAPMVGGVCSQGDVALIVLAATSAAEEARSHTHRASSHAVFDDLLKNPNFTFGAFARSLISQMMKVPLGPLQEVSLDNSLAEKDSKLPSGAVAHAATRVYKSISSHGKVRRLRISLLYVAEEMQALNCACYPGHEYEQPLLWLDFVLTCRNQHSTVTMDFVPLSSSDEYQFRYCRAPLKSIWQTCAMNGQLAEAKPPYQTEPAPYSSNVAFVSQVDLNQLSLSSPVFEAFLRYCSAYVQILTTAKPGELVIMHTPREVRQAQANFDFWKSEIDPMMDVYQEYFGKEWAEKFVAQLKFPSKHTIVDSIEAFKHRPDKQMQQLADQLWDVGVAQYFSGRLCGTPAAGLKVLEASVKADGTRAERHHFLGALHASAGSTDAACTCWEAAIASDAAFHDAYIELVNLHEDEGRYDSARATALRAVEQQIYWTSCWQRPDFFIRGLASVPWWHAQDFPWVSELVGVYPEIKAELTAFLRQQDSQLSGMSSIGSTDADSHDAELVEGGVWRLIDLVNDYDSFSTAARHSFPCTISHLKRIVPEAVAMAQTGLGEILISALAPGTRLKPHCVQNNFRLTCHLGLLCPQGARIRVGPTWRTWNEGECLLFDDSYEHEVLNEGEGLRVVLLIRFWHPDFPQSQRALAPDLDEMAQFDLWRRSLIPPMGPKQALAVRNHLDFLVSGGQATEEVHTLLDILAGPS